MTSRTIESYEEYGGRIAERRLLGKKGAREGEGN
jgi:hypothetical protein